MADMKPPQTIQHLRERYEKLNNAKVTAETSYKIAHEALEQLKTEAREKYQTDDLEQLKAKLAEMQAANERKRSEYQAHLDKIESDLKEVERKFGQSQGAK